jgi:membrane-associated phospholipid phosphatase
MAEPMQPAAARDLVVASLTRPYRVTFAMVALMALVPMYLVLAGVARGGVPHRPALAWDTVIPLQPAWVLVYGPLYLFLILLPVFVVHQEEHIRRTVHAYLMVWTAAYACFLIYPTIAPRPEHVGGTGFAAWGLRFLYDADPPYNCFPSLHVAHSFVSALSASRVHRRLGLLAVAAAFLVGISTLFTKQHYVLDVVGGVALAVAAHGVFLRGYPEHRVSQHERAAAPLLAGVTGVLVVVAAGIYWVVYQIAPQICGECAH